MAKVTDAHQKHLDLINELRKSVGVHPLHFSQILHDAAYWKANAMANGDWFAHTEPEGRTARQLVMSFGYPASAGTGECILYGEGDPTEAFEQWRDSPDHYANMVSPYFTEIGIALGVEDAWDFSGDVFKVSVQEYGNGNTQHPQNGTEPAQGATETPQTTPSTSKPVQTYPAPIHADKSLGRKIRRRVNRLLRGIRQ